MSHLLVISPDVIGKQMAAVGIRYWNMAGALARQGIEVTLAVPGQGLPRGEALRVVSYDETSYESLSPHLEGIDALLESLFDVLPIGWFNNPGDQIEREDPICALFAPVDTEGDSHLQHRRLCRPLPPLQRAWG